MTDVPYPGNSQNPLGDPGVVPGTPPQAPKEIEKIETTSPVVLKKPPLRRKVKGLLFDGSFKTAAQYIFLDVLIPTVKNMIVDAATKGVERVIYGDRAVARRNVEPSRSRISYNSPVVRYGERSVMYPDQPPRYTDKRKDLGDIILGERHEAELVLERMNDAIDKYGSVSVLDLHEMLQLPYTHVDNKWGWTRRISNACIRQDRAGYLIEFPPVDLLA